MAPNANYESSFHQRQILSMRGKPQEASAGEFQLGTMGDENNAVTASVPKGETHQAILAVLQQCRESLQSKNISGKSHVLTTDERAGMVKRVRRKYDSAAVQQRLPE